MTTKLGRLAQTWLTLLACGLVVGVPGGTLRLKICDHNGVVVNPPCEEETGQCAKAPVEVDSCCPSAPSPSGDQDDAPGEPGDSCCTDVPTPNLLVHGDGGPKAADDGDVEPEPECDAAPLPPRATEPRPRLARATGPPDDHRALRHLSERATIVLLI